MIKILSHLIREMFSLNVYICQYGEMINNHSYRGASCFTGGNCSSVYKYLLSYVSRVKNGCLELRTRSSGSTIRLSNRHVIKTLMTDRQEVLSHIYTPMIYWHQVNINISVTYTHQ